MLFWIIRRVGQYPGVKTALDIIKAFHLDPVLVSVHKFVIQNGAPLFMEHFSVEMLGQGVFFPNPLARPVNEPVLKVVGKLCMMIRRVRKKGSSV